MQIKGVFGLAGMSKGQLVRAYRQCYDGMAVVPDFFASGLSIGHAMMPTMAGLTFRQDVSARQQFTSVAPIYDLLIRNQAELARQQEEFQRRQHELHRDHVGLVRDMLTRFDTSFQTMMETMGKMVDYMTVANSGQNNTRPSRPDYSGVSFVSTVNPIKTGLHKSGGQTNAIRVGVDEESGKIVRISG